MKMDGQTDVHMDSHMTNQILLNDGLTNFSKVWGSTQELCYKKNCSNNCYIL